MSIDTDVQDHADLSTRRYRSFVARQIMAVPVGERPMSGDDLPVLTEIVTPASVASTVSAIDPAALRAALEESLCRWLDAALPQLLEKLEHGTRQEL